MNVEGFWEALSISQSLEKYRRTCQCMYSNIPPGLPKIYSYVYSCRQYFARMVARKKNWERCSRLSGILTKRKLTGMRAYVRKIYICSGGRGVDNIVTSSRLNHQKVPVAMEVCMGSKRQKKRCGGMRRQLFSHVCISSGDGDGTNIHNRKMLTLLYLRCD